MHLCIGYRDVRLCKKTKKTKECNYGDEREIRKMTMMQLTL